MAPDRHIPYALLTSKLRCVRKKISCPIHSLGFSAILYLLHCASYLIYPSSAAQCSQPSLPFLAPCPSRGPSMLPVSKMTLLGHGLVGQVIPTQISPPSERHPGLWWPRSLRVCPQHAALALPAKPRLPTWNAETFPHLQAGL